MFDASLENYELRLQDFREESKEYYDIAENFFKNKYESKLKDVFPRDVLGIKKHIGGRFILAYGEDLLQGKIPKSDTIFEEALQTSLKSIPLSSTQKSELYNAIVFSDTLTKTKEQCFSKITDISRDPFFALVEDFSLDGEISKEEFLLLEKNFATSGNFLQALDSLPMSVKRLFETHIGMSLEKNFHEKQAGFEGEFYEELAVLEKTGIQITLVIKFVSRFYYKTPGKYRKYEHPKRRLRRTMKLALLKLLRIQYGNVQAENILKKFEQGESFKDYFMIIFKLMEVLDENPQSEEVYSVLKNEDEVQLGVFTAEENKQKILEGEGIVMNIAKLFSKSEDSEEVSEEMLEKTLSRDTDMIGEDFYFNREQGNAGIYAEGTLEEEEEEHEDDDIDYSSPEVVFEILQHRFKKLEKEKTEKFLYGNYADIDEINEKLLDIQVKLEKLHKILGLVED